MSNEKRIELKSEDINDILSRPPKWIVRWGNTLMIIIVISLIILASQFKLPESVVAPVNFPGGVVNSGVIILPESKIDGVKKGQQVRIILNNYPQAEYGFVNAIVSDVSVSSGNNGFYSIELQLPDGLNTNKGVNLNSNEAIPGLAEILTGEASLLEKLSRPLKKVINEI